MRALDYSRTSVIIAAAAGLFATCGEGAGAATPKDHFKALLSSPPTIERMIFMERLPKDPNHAVPLDTGLADSTNSLIYELRWQTNATFLRTLKDPSGFTNYTMSGRCFTLWNDQFYFLDNPKSAVLYVLEEAKAAQGNYTGPYHATTIRKGKATQILNLGINHVKPGTIRWEGDSFSASAIADKRPIQVQGHITGYSNGIPSEMHVEYFNESGIARYRLLYDYASFAPPYYPSRIRINFFYKDKEVEYQDYTIQSVQVAAKPLPSTHYDPKPFIDANQLQLQYFTNGSVYFALPSGQLIETFGNAPKTKLSRADYKLNRYYYLAVLATAAFFVAWCMKVIRAEKHPKTTTIL
jgi:hypothetical protein